MADRIDTLTGADLLAEARARILREMDSRGRPDAWHYQQASAAAWHRLEELGQAADYLRIREEVRAERRERDRHNAAQAARINGRTDS